MACRGLGLLSARQPRRGGGWQQWQGVWCVAPGCGCGCVCCVMPHPVRCCWRHLPKGDGAERAAGSPYHTPGVGGTCSTANCASGVRQQQHVDTCEQPPPGAHHTSPSSPTAAPAVPVAAVAQGYPSSTLPASVQTHILHCSATLWVGALSHPFIPHARCWEKLHWHPSAPMLLCEVLPAPCGCWSVHSACLWLQLAGPSTTLHPSCSSAGPTHAAWARTGAGVEQVDCRETAVVWLQGSMESAPGVNMYHRVQPPALTPMRSSTEGTLLQAASAEQKEGRLHPSNQHPMTQRHQHTAQACGQPLRAH